MIKKITSILIILAILTGLLCSCGSSGEVSFVVPIDSDPLCLDPQIANSQNAKMIVNNCYEGLVRLDEKYQIIPGVAETWDISSDGLTYTFHLRTDTKWQLLKSYEGVLEEGYMDSFSTTVTANDFRFALMRAVDSITQSDDAEKLFCIKNAKAINEAKMNKTSLGVTATNDSTLVITLERANDDFLRILTLPICMPCNEKFFNATHAKYGLELKYTFCNGPFYLSRWTADNSLTIRKSENYRGNSKVNPTLVYFYINDDEESVISKLKQKSYDISFLSDSAHATLSENNKILQMSSDNTVTGFCFNCNDDTMKNVNIRKALIMLTKLNEISKPKSAVNSATGIVPDCVRFGSESYREAAGKIVATAYNEATAIALWNKGLTELEYENASVKITCTEEYSAQMQSAIQNWQKLLGTKIVAKVEVVTQDELDTAVKNDSFQIVIDSISTGSSTVTDTLKMFTGANNKNIFNFADTTYDNMVNAIITSASGKGILTQCKAAEQYLINNAVFYPLFTDSEYMAIGKDVTGVYALPAFESVFFANGGRS